VKKDEPVAPSDVAQTSETGSAGGPARAELVLSVNGRRLWSRLQEMADVGAMPESDGGGISRPSFGPAHAEAVRKVAGWMREAGLEVGLDATGNLIGLLRGRDADEPAIGVGSHLDTVPNGGAFDGALGVLAALEAVQTMVERGERPRHSVAVLGFADEEGNTFGIGVLSAQLWCDEIPPEGYGELVDAEGRTLIERVAAFDVADVPAVERPRLRAYVEAHVEQGPVLEQGGRRAAAVESIVGIARSTVVFRGIANHAGTTPMEARRDASWAGSELVLAVRELALASGGLLVGTVGVFEVSPGATNVVPGSVRLRVELRSADPDLLQKTSRAVDLAAATAAERHGLGLETAAWHVAPPVAMDTTIFSAICHAIEGAGLPRYSMPSWAGHDAKVMARHLPTGMVFVPSIAGVSHAPDERTDAEDCAIAAEILRRTILRLDVVA